MTDTHSGHFGGLNADAIAVSSAPTIKTSVTVIMVFSSR
jgi:hypothetical protein